MHYLDDDDDNDNDASDDSNNLSAVSHDRISVMCPLRPSFLQVKSLILILSSTLLIEILILNSMFCVPYLSQFPSLYLSF
jgi:hypothetical protein